MDLRRSNNLYNFLSEGQRKQVDDKVETILSTQLDESSDTFGSDFKREKLREDIANQMFSVLRG